MKNLLPNIPWRRMLMPLLAAFVLLLGGHAFGDEASKPAGAAAPEAPAEPASPGDSDDYMDEDEAEEKKSALEFEDLGSALDALRKVAEGQDGTLHIPAGKRFRGDIVQENGRPVIVDGEVKGDIVLTGSPITVNGTVRGDIVNVGGRIEIRGKVTGDVVSIGGNIVSSGKIRGSAVSIGGLIQFEEGASVDKDVVAMGGGIEGQERAKIEGKTVNMAPFRMMMNWKADSCPPLMGLLGFWFSLFAIALRIFVIILWIGLAVLLEALMGERLANASQNLGAHWLRNGLVGLLWCFVGLALFILFLILSFVLIGIPFLLLLLVFWAALYVFGMVTVFRSLGGWLARALGRPQMSGYMAVTLGALLVGLLKFIPILGILAGCLLGLAGVGTALMSRFGKGGNGGIRIIVGDASAPMQYSSGEEMPPQP